MGKGFPLQTNKKKKYFGFHVDCSNFLRSVCLRAFSSLWRLLLSINGWEINRIGTVTFCLSPLFGSWNVKESHLFSCDSSASTWWRLCKVSFKWDINHLWSCSFTCPRLSHSSTWDVSKDNAFDFHIDLGCLRGRLTLWGLFPDQMARHWPHTP